MYYMEIKNLHIETKKQIVADNYFLFNNSRTTGYVNISKDVTLNIQFLTLHGLSPSGHPLKKDKNGWGFEPKSHIDLFLNVFENTFKPAIKEHYSKPRFFLPQKHTEKSLIERKKLKFDLRLKLQKGEETIFPHEKIRLGFSPDTLIVRDNQVFRKRKRIPLLTGGNINELLNEAVELILNFTPFSQEWEIHKIFGKGEAKYKVWCSYPPAELSFRAHGETTQEQLDNMGHAYVSNGEVTYKLPIF